MSNPTVITREEVPVQEALMAAQLEVNHNSQTFYTLAERLLSFEAADEGAARVAQEYLKGFRLKPSVARAGVAADFTISLLTEDAPPIPQGLQKFELPHGICFTDGERYYLDINESRIAVGAQAARRMHVWFGRTREARHPVALVNVMSYVLHMALRRSALYDLHAAGVVEPASGGGVLFVGDSGSGKTSLTLRLTRSGWSYLSDDLLVFYEQGDAIEAQGLRRVFSVSPSNLFNCELPRLEEALGVAAYADPDKRRLEPSVVFPEKFAERCIPRVLYFASISGEKKSRMAEVGQSDALIRLVKTCPWSSFDATARQNLRVLSRLVKQVKAYDLFAGRDMLDDPAHAAALFAAHVNR